METNKLLKSDFCWRQWYFFVWNEFTEKKNLIHRLDCLFLIIWPPGSSTHGWGRNGKIFFVNLTSTLKYEANLKVKINTVTDSNTVVKSSVDVTGQQDRNQTFPIKTKSRRWCLMSDWSSESFVSLS